MPPALDHPLQQSLDRLTHICQAARQSISDLTTALESLKALAGIELEGIELEGTVQQQINALKNAQQQLQQPALRLLALGDVKRGKSTVLNALLGAAVLPTAPHPCTALITVLRYGPESNVTLHFVDQCSPESLSLEDFHQRYTLAQSAPNALPFPAISHAVIEYPSPLLQAAVEIVDSPGLNDTEALNQRALQYLNSCHTVLFVMRAIQPCTLTEQRYIQTHLTGKGMHPFFLLNGWDEIQASLLDPHDPAALAHAEGRLQQVFAASLTDYIAAEPGFNLAERVFPVSALQSLRHSLNGAAPDPGFARFVTTLTQFVTTQRTRAQLGPLTALSQQIGTQVQQWQTADQSHTHRRLQQLKQEILTTAAPFEALADRKAAFSHHVRHQRQAAAVQLADSIKHHFTQGRTTFEPDFSRYQPPLQLADQLTPSARQAYQTQLESAFQRYLTDHLDHWRVAALSQLQAILSPLAQTATPHGKGHRTVPHKILSAIQLPLEQPSSTADWMDWVSDLFIASEDIAQAARQPFYQRLDALPLSLWTVAYQATQSQLEAYGRTVVARMDAALNQQQQHLQQQLAQRHLLQQQYDQRQQQWGRIIDTVEAVTAQLDQG
ncbi:MAG: dynamin family protein [Cyanobacteria bacterium P01_A01_bin.105]